MRGCRSLAHGCLSTGDQPSPNPCCLPMRRLWLYRTLVGRKSTPWTFIPIRAWGRGRQTTLTTSQCGLHVDRPRNKARSQPQPSNVCSQSALPVAVKENDTSITRAAFNLRRDISYTKTNSLREVRLKENGYISRQIHSKQS